MPRKVPKNDINGNILQKKVKRYDDFFMAVSKKRPDTIFLKSISFLKTARNFAISWNSSIFFNLIRKILKKYRKIFFVERITTIYTISYTCVTLTKYFIENNGKI